MRLDRRAAVLTAIALGFAVATGAAAQIGAGTERVGDSASLSAGMPIAAPETVDPEQPVTVSVENAGPGARIELWGPVTQDGRGRELAEVPLAGGTATVTAPTEPASYELRYFGPEGAQLGRRAFDVAAVPVALTVRTPVAPGGTLSVTWEGPASPGDRFEIVGPDGAVLETVPVAGDPVGRNLSELTAPDRTGPMELRYVTAPGTVLRTVPFDVSGTGG